MENANNKNDSLAVLIDADNVSASQADAIFKRACSLGEPIVRRAYGMVNCFSATGGWTKVQREYGIVAKPQISNVSGKNVADIALVVDAMEILYRGTCHGICIVSSDSDFTALAAKIREAGKKVYGLGNSKTPESFRVACTQFFEMPLQRKEETKKAPPAPPSCPRCGGKLVQGWTKSRKACQLCESCGGMSVKLSFLRGGFSDESIQELLASAKEHKQPGCLCPNCKSSMSLLRVARGSKHVDIDVCPSCQSVWYDKNEFESLVPNDGALHATISAGKSFRRDMVLTVTSDLQTGRRKAPNLTSLRNILKTAYHVPTPDIDPILSTLRSQKIIAVDKKNAVKVCARPQNRP